MSDDIDKILTDAGYRVVTGHDAVQSAIKEAGKGRPSKPLCSGYRVFPDGTKCSGCDDCKGRDAE